MNSEIKQKKTLIVQYHTCRTTEVDREQQLPQQREVEVGLKKVRRVEEVVVEETLVEQKCSWATTSFVHSFPT